MAIRKLIYKTRDLAHAGEFDYIEVFYNRTHCHRHLGGVSLKALSKKPLRKARNYLREWVGTFHRLAVSGVAYKAVLPNQLANC